MYLRITCIHAKKKKKEKKKKERKKEEKIQDIVSVCVLYRYRRQISLGVRLVTRPPHTVRPLAISRAKPVVLPGLYNYIYIKHTTHPSEKHHPLAASQHLWCPVLWELAAFTDIGLDINTYTCILCRAWPKGLQFLAYMNRFFYGINIVLGIFLQLDSFVRTDIYKIGHKARHKKVINWVYGILKIWKQVMFTKLAC